MKLTSALFAFMLLGTMYLSLFHVAHSGTMDGKMEGCPYMIMSSEETLCAMTLIDHLEAWKSLSLAIIGNVVILFAFVGLYISCALFLRQRVPVWEIPIRTFKEQYIYFYTLRSLQELFARGILHPKLF